MRNHEAVRRKVLPGAPFFTHFFGLARGIMVGMVLGAHLGKNSLPDEWVSGLIKREEIVALLKKIT